MKGTPYVSSVSAAQNPNRCNGRKACGDIRNMNQLFATGIDLIVWEPQFPLKPFQRVPWEPATIIDVSVSGARVQARANRAITPGTRIAIGSGSLRGLVEICRVDATPNPALSCYSVRYIWLDSDLQARFEVALVTGT